MDKLTIAQRLYISTAAFLVLIALIACFFVNSVQSNVDFAKLEKDGNSYQRPLTSILAKLSYYELAGILPSNSGKLETLAALSTEIDSDFNSLQRIDKKLGEALQFTPQGLASRKREHLNVTEVKAKWETLRYLAPKLAAKEFTGKTQELIADIRGMITHMGDTSNLILDPDLDSYYLMDVTLAALPQTLDRIGLIGNKVYSIIANGKPLTEEEKVELQRLASLLKESDINRTMGDFPTVFNEDANFYGISPTLKTNIEPAMQRYQQANEALADMLKSIAGGTQANSDTWIKTVQRASGSAFELWKISVTELDILLDKRISDYHRYTLLVLASVIIGLLAAIGFFYVVIRSIRQPLAEVQHAMVVIGDGNLDFAVPHLEKRDEIGDMAKSLQHFRETARKAKALDEHQKLEQLYKEERQRKIEEVVRAFSEVSSQSVEMVAGAATELEATAGSMATIVKEADLRASTVDDVSSVTSTNVQTVATAAEQLSYSIREIVVQISHSSQGVKDTMQEVMKGEQSAEQLAIAATEIGNITNLIQSIAEQINLLALNATIESARAGDAGKGFAVVASEVKNLATQTAQATHNITQQIVSVQEIASQMINVITSIKKMVTNVNEYSNAIATAAEQQSNATNEIAQNIQVTAEGVSEITNNISTVKSATNSAEHATQEVLQASNMLSQQAETLNNEIKQFLISIQSA